MKFYRALALSFVLLASNQLLAGDLILNGKESYESLDGVFYEFDNVHFKKGQENYDIEWFNNSARVLGEKLGKKLKDWDDKDLETIRDFLEKEYLEAEKNRTSSYSAGNEFYRIKQIKERFPVFKEKFKKLKILDKEVSEKQQNEAKLKAEIDSIAKALRNSGITVDPNNANDDISFNLILSKITPITEKAEKYPEIVKSWDGSFVGKNIEKYTDQDFDLLEKYWLAKARKNLNLDNKIKNFFDQLKTNIKSQKEKLNKVIKEKGENENIEIPYDYTLIQEIFKWAEDKNKHGWGGKKNYEKYTEIAKNKFGKKFKKWTNDDYKILEDYVKKNIGTLDLNFISNDENSEAFIKQFKKGLELAYSHYYTQIEDFTGQWSCGNPFSLGHEKYISLDLAAIEPIIALTGYNDIYGVNIKNWNEDKGIATIEFNLTNNHSSVNVWTISLTANKDEMIVKTSTDSFTYKKISSEIDTDKTRKGYIETITYEDFELDRKQLRGKKIKMKGYIYKRVNGEYVLLKTNKNLNLFEAIKLYTDELDRDTRKWLLHNCENNNMPLITLTALVYNESKLKVLKIDETK